MPQTSTIIIDATSRMLYSSFYIKGLQEVFGKRNVSFSFSKFKDLNRKQGEFTFEHYFAFAIVNENLETKKVVIDFCDSLDVNENAYNWCDFYAKINIKLEFMPNYNLEKLILIPPGFGIRIWTIWETIFYCFLNLAKSNFNPIVTFKRFFQDYYTQFKRPKINQYKNTYPIDNQYEKENNNIFLIATLWDESEEKTNLERKKFIEIVKTKSCNFEGGFFANSNHPRFHDYKHLIFETAYTIFEYLKKTKKSILVFNTPAVHNCHGWKLPEYLAMGKAIISTPLSNDLNFPLINGETICIVNSTEELHVAIDLLLSDKDYRNRLEKNAVTYFDKFLNPEMVIQNLMQKIAKRS